VHTRRYEQRTLDAINAVPQLQFETEEDGIRLYRLK
jgi:hypothetical protein